MKDRAPDARRCRPAPELKSRRWGYGRHMRIGRSALAILLLAGCASSGPQPLGLGLGGTAWQLVAIQSMDDTQGTTKINAPERFTLQFGSDGQANLRLDCNRGMGRYDATAASDGRSGSIQFGPIAATRARCPPPHLDERVARDLPHVRGYLLKDGKLFLSLMADGGIYEWAPITSKETIR